VLLSQAAAVHHQLHHRVHHVHAVIRLVQSIGMSWDMPHTILLLPVVTVITHVIAMGMPRRIWPIIMPSTMDAMPSGINADAFAFPE
jgi:hypothetical protein